MGTLPQFPTSWTCSTPAGRRGWPAGKGRSRVWIEGWAERRGSRIGRFLGVSRTVRVMPRRASWWVKSRKGRMWPWAGYGMSNTWTPSPFLEHDIVAANFNSSQQVNGMVFAMLVGAESTAEVGLECLISRVKKNMICPVGGVSKCTEIRGTG
nr:hypothetical protein CRG98_015167 [Ipomoea trifida]